MNPTKRKKKSGESDTETARARKSTRPDEMSAEVMEFITAVDEYKRAHQRPFPTWSEVLEILKALGYQRSH